MLKFCFPERDPDSIEDGEEDNEGTLKAGASSSSLVSTGSKKIKKKGKDSNSNFYVKRDKKDKDDVEKMKVCWTFCFYSSVLVRAADGKRLLIVLSNVETYH